MITTTAPSHPKKTEKLAETTSISLLMKVGALALLIPIVLFALSRLTGGLMSHEAWMNQAAEASTNHGPWRYEWQGLTLMLPFIAPLLTLVVGLRHLLRGHMTRSSRCLGFAVLQFALAAVVYAMIGWTID